MASIDQEQAALHQTKEERSQEVFDLGGLGATLPNILRHAKAKGLSAEAAMKALRDADLMVDQAAAPLLARERDADLRAAKQLHYVQLMHLFARCMANQEHGTARAVLADKAQLLDLLPPSRKEVYSEHAIHAASVIRATLANPRSRELIASLTVDGRYSPRLREVPAADVEVDEVPGEPELHP